jgi:signal transduction histidine kinase
MFNLSTDAKSGGLGRALSRRRVIVALICATLIGLIPSLVFKTPFLLVMSRFWMVGLCALLAFGLFEQWPKRLPRWQARWVLQLIGVVLSIPVTAFLAYWITTGDSHFWLQKLRMTGFLVLIVSGILFAPWIAVAAMVRQRDDFARAQASAFEVERSELERQANEARMRLLQAQVQPHFLFNTLANVQALVDSGSPQASKVLGSLIAYLRAAVPRINDPVTTMGQEIALVRAYLELMQLRMPDRLQYSLNVEPAALSLRCPPLTLLTLVENAVRHGIDPSEEGGRIDVTVRLASGRCRVSVIDSGVGIGMGSSGLGTGLPALRERLALSFGKDAALRLLELAPHGVCAELDFPVAEVKE